MDAQFPEIPDGYVHIFQESEIPPGWTAMDGANGTPNLKECWGTLLGPGLCMPQNVVYCMKNWPAFSEEHPEWAETTIQKGKK